MPKFTINPAPGSSTAWGRKYIPGEEVEIPAELVEKLKKRGIIGEVKAAPAPEEDVLVVDAGNIPSAPQVASEDKKAAKKGRTAKSV